MLSWLEKSIAPINMPHNGVYNIGRLSRIESETMSETANRDTTRAHKTPKWTKIFPDVLRCPSVTNDRRSDTRETRKYYSHLMKALVHKHELTQSTESAGNDSSHMDKSIMEGLLNSPTALCLGSLIDLEDMATT